MSILYTLAMQFDIEALRPAKGALRQGVIFDLDERVEAARNHRLPDPRDSSVRELQQRFRVDTSHADRIRHRTLALWQQLAEPLAAAMRGHYAVISAAPYSVTAAIAVTLLALAWLGHAATGEAAEGETTILGDLLSRALSTPTSRVSIGAVDGALSSDATIRDVAIADRNGVWLRLDKARLIWRRTALLSRRLEARLGRAA